MMRVGLDSMRLAAAATRRAAPKCCMRYIVIAALILIVATLASALYYLYHDRGQSTRMVKALAIRVALSASLIIFLVVSYKMGWIGPSGLR